MKASIMFVKAIVSISILLIVPAQIIAEEQAVVQVMTIDTHGNTKAYLENVKTVIDRQNQVVPGLRTKIYQAGLAGTDVGTLYVVVEFTSMQSMAESLAKLQADAEWNRLRKIAAVKTERTMLSHSLLYDITP